MYFSTCYEKQTYSNPLQSRFNITFHMNYDVFKIWILAFSINHSSVSIKKIVCNMNQSTMRCPHVINDSIQHVTLIHSGNRLSSVGIMNQAINYRGNFKFKKLIFSDMELCQNPLDTEQRLVSSLYMLRYRHNSMN